MTRATLIFILLTNYNIAEAQPFAITAYIDSTVIEAKDYSSLQSLTYTGTGGRWMFDRRIDDWEFITAFLFNAVFDDGLSTEIVVNPEFGSEANAQIEANHYAFIVGQLPKCLRSEIHEVWIHQGTESFGGGFNALLIHVGMSPTYENLGILEEVLFHEATHTGLDLTHSSAPNWILAQNSDNYFISTYGAGSPSEEDLAESFLTWYMVRQCDRRVSLSDSLLIEQTIPNRLTYFDSQGFDMYPMCVEQLNASISVKPQLAFDVYPIPTEDFISIRISEFSKEEHFSLFDYNNRTVLTGILSSTESSIDLSMISAGIYFLKLESSELPVRIVKE